MPVKPMEKCQYSRAVVKSGGRGGHRKSPLSGRPRREAQTVVAWQYFGIPVKDLRLPHSPHKHGGKIDGSSNSSDKRRRSHGMWSSSRVGWGIGGLGWRKGRGQGRDRQGGREGEGVLRIPVCLRFSSSPGWEAAIRG